MPSPDPGPSGPRLQRTLLRWVLGPLLVLLVLDTAATWWTSLRFSHLAHDRSLQEIARELALHVKAAPGGPRLELSAAAERVLLQDSEDRLAFRVLGPDGRTRLAGSDALPPPPASLPRGGSPVFDEAPVDGDAMRVVSAWMTVEADPALAVLVQVGETLHKRNRLAREILANVVVPQLLLILLACGAVVLGVRHGVAPLRRLERAVQARSHLDLSPVDARGVPAEVQPLVREVNDLMERVGRTLDFQTRFMADAAHQLKTPVSGLKAQLELALREHDPQRLRHSLAQLYVSTDRMSRLVQQLLSLARNEPGAAASLRLQPLDLRAFALETSMEWVPVALRSDVDLGFESEERPLMIHADPDRLRELMNNLIDNAVRYTHAGGRVTVRVDTADADHARIAISDDGPRIPVEDRGRVFERFHRLLGAPADGSGLGLAIVSEIATLHDARITLEEDTDGVGNTFSVLFPLRAAPALSAG